MPKITQKKKIPTKKTLPKIKLSWAIIEGFPLPFFVIHTPPEEGNEKAQNLN